jgi:hypothetical protein
MYASLLGPGIMMDTLVPTARPGRCAASLRLAEMVLIIFSVYDPGVGDPEGKRGFAGKSKTCRASAWLSHRIRVAFNSKHAGLVTNG